MGPSEALTGESGHPLVVPAEQASALVFVPFPVWFHNGINTRPIRQDGTHPMARRQRLDLELVARGLAVSRQQAQQLIRSGRVRSGDRVLDKPGVDVTAELALEVERPPRFVSRGGEKLLAALEQLPIPVAGRVCLDGGISTGGFTDCLLQHGASRVYGIDVGYGQTAWSLRTDPRVVLRERTNLRHLTPADLYGPEDPWPDLAVADVSFISLTRVLPALGALLRPAMVAEQSMIPDQVGVEALLLVKPQFEVGRGRVGKGGVVRDPAAHVDAIETVLAAAVALGWEAAGLVASPITGPAGNHEYLLWLRRPAQAPAPGASGSATNADDPRADAGAEDLAAQPVAESRTLESMTPARTLDSPASDHTVGSASEGVGRGTSAAGRANQQAAAGRANQPVAAGRANQPVAAGRDGETHAGGLDRQGTAPGGAAASGDATCSGAANVAIDLQALGATQPPATGTEAGRGPNRAPVDRSSIRALVQRTLAPR